MRPDAIILDLEDAVASGDKDTARAAVRYAQTQIKSVRIGCVVRVNAGLGAMLVDMDALDLAATNAIIVPKCDGVRGQEKCRRETGRTIELMESPAVLSQLSDIVAKPACGSLCRDRS